MHRALRQSPLRSDLPDGRFGAVCLPEPFGFPCGAARELLQPPADMDSAVFAEQPPDLAEDHRHGIGRKADAPRRIKRMRRLDQSEAARGIQLLVFDAALAEPVCAEMHQPEMRFSCDCRLLHLFHASASFAL